MTRLLITAAVLGCCGVAATASAASCPDGFVVSQGHCCVAQTVWNASEARCTPAAEVKTLDRTVQLGELGGGAEGAQKLGGTDGVQKLVGAEVKPQLFEVRASTADGGVVSGDALITFSSQGGKELTDHYTLGELRQVELPVGITRVELSVPGYQTAWQDLTPDFRNPAMLDFRLSTARVPVAVEIDAQGDSRGDAAFRVELMSGRRRLGECNTEERRCTMQVPADWRNLHPELKGFGPLDIDKEVTFSDAVPKTGTASIKVAITRSWFNKWGWWVAAGVAVVAFGASLAAAGTCHGNDCIDQSLVAASIIGGIDTILVPLLFRYGPRGSSDLSVSVEP